MDWTFSLREFCIHRGLLGQLVTSRYTKNVTLRWIFTVKSLFEAVGPCVRAQIVPTKCLPVNARQTHRTQR